MNYISQEYRSWKIQYDDVVVEEYGCPEPDSDCAGSNEATSLVSGSDSENSVASDKDNDRELDRGTISQMFARTQHA